MMGDKIYRSLNNSVVNWDLRILWRDSVSKIHLWLNKENIQRKIPSNLIVKCVCSVWADFWNTLMWAERRDVLYHNSIVRRSSSYNLTQTHTISQCVTESLHSLSYRIPYTVTRNHLEKAAGHAPWSHTGHTENHLQTVAVPAFPCLGSPQQITQSTCFTPDALPNTILPFYPGLWPAMRVNPFSFICKD